MEATVARATAEATRVLKEAMATTTATAAKTPAAVMGRVERAALAWASPARVDPTARAWVEKAASHSSAAQQSQARTLVTDTDMAATRTRQVRAVIIMMDMVTPNLPRVMPSQARNMANQITGLIMMAGGIAKCTNKLDKIDPPEDGTISRSTKSKELEPRELLSMM